MADKLTKQIRNLEEQHADEFIEKRMQILGQSDREQAIFSLGEISAFEKLSKVLSAGSMKRLIQFQEMKMHESLGFDRFEGFLNESPHSPMTKNQFYERMKLLKIEGETLFDLLNEAGVPASTRKLIAQTTGADIIIEGDEILIGEERADVSNLPLIKTLIKSLATANEKFHGGKKKQDDEIKSLKSEIELGTQQYQELERAMDAASSGTPYEIALTKAVGSLINLAIAAKNSPIIEKDARGRADIETLWQQMLNVRTALLQDDFVFTDEAFTNENPVPALAKKALAIAGDWGDEDEK